jgi:hypothetical protein
MFVTRCGVYASRTIVRRLNRENGVIHTVSQNVVRKNKKIKKEKIRNLTTNALHRTGELNNKKNTVEQRVAGRKMTKENRKANDRDALGASFPARSEENVEPLRLLRIYCALHRF